MSEDAVVVGVGNPDRGDDGVGAAAVARLEAFPPPGVRLVRLSGADPAQLMEAWAGAARVVVVDAMASGAPIGTVRRFDCVAGPLPAEVHLASTHALGAGAAIEMARALGRLPGHLVVYGVEGGSFATGAGLSPEVAAALPEAVRRIRLEVGGA